MKLIYKGLGVMTLLLTAGALPAQQAATAYLKTNVRPGRAVVFVDGKYVGPAGNFGMGRKYALPAGQHQVKLVDPRYEEFSTTVDLKAGQTTKLAETLKPLPPPKGPLGGLRTPVPEKYAAVYINDKFYGHAGEFNNSSQKLMLPVGEYSVRIEPASGAPINQKVKIEAGKTVLVQ
ncbi:MAG: PEGA domain-containing protein [Candidatus Solibacter sp.]|nr:PEGA domain-containing protein [Candidatus Solibacter sp.]